MDTITIDRGGLWYIKELLIVIKEVRECLNVLLNSNSVAGKRVWIIKKVIIYNVDDCNYRF